MNTKSEQKKLYILSLKVKVCFRGFFIGAVLNFSFLFWTSDWGISIRIIINYFLWPFLGYIIGGHLTEINDNYKQKNIKKSRLLLKKYGNYGLLILLFLVTILLAGLHINYEQDKKYCKEEITVNNYISCINEAKNNILNISRIFND